MGLLDSTPAFMAAFDAQLDNIRDELTTALSAPRGPNLAKVRTLNRDLKLMKKYRVDLDHLDSGLVTISAIAKPYPRLGQGHFCHRIGNLRGIFRQEKNGRVAALTFPAKP